MVAQNQISTMKTIIVIISSFLIAAASVLANHQEILVNPNSQARIECKLPQLNSNNRFYYWNFQQTASNQAKPHLLCYESKCGDAKSFGVQLDIDRDSNSYDLVINNVTYELNDGLYYCDYTDSNPETKQTINREYRLTVLIPPQAPTIVTSSAAPAREGQDYQLNCVSSGGNPEPNITWFRNEQLLSAASPNLLPGLKIEQSRANGSTTSTLSWIPTLDDHSAIYKCYVWNKAMLGQQAFEREHKLQVEFAPRINLGMINPLKVLLGSQVTLPCSVEANPPVKGIQWLKDNQIISNSYNLTIREAKISDSSVYSCQADNGIAPPSMHSPIAAGSSAATSGVSSFGNFFNSLLLPSAAGSSSSSAGAEQKSPTTVEAQIHLQVLYGPRVQVKPSKVLPLNLGDYFMLNCSVDSSPAPYEYVWTKSDDPNFRKVSSSSNSYLEFQSIAPSDSGNYTCTAYNRLEPSGYSQAIDKQASASFVVQVRHSPGVARILLASNSNGETESGSKTQIQCRADPPGYPEPSYKYWKYTANGNQKLFLTKQAHGPIYTIYSAQTSDEARYGCLAYNDLGSSSEADGELIVNEPPTIIRDSHRRESDSRFQGDYPYIITVRATGKPEPKVSWFHRSPIDGRMIELSSLEMMSKFKIETNSKAELQAPGSSQISKARFNVITTLTFKQPLEINDRGQYSVRFSNGLSRTATEDLQLHINHTPIPMLKNQPLLAGPSQQSASAFGASSSFSPKARVKAGFDLGETVNLTCRVSAYPKPAFDWWTPGAGAQPGNLIESSANSRYSIQSTNPRDDIWESVLTFAPAQESDYGDYVCVSANQDQQANRMSDSVHVVVSLSKKTIPDVPSQFEAIDSNQDSVTLQWNPGFDGGYPQNTYLIQYAIDDGSGQSLSKRFPNSLQQESFLNSVLASASGYGNQNLLDNIEQQQGMGGAYPKFFDCYSMNPCTISQLLPRQSYIFKVRARNEKGSSEYSEELRASTRANISQIPKIFEASFDSKNNILHFKIEPGSDYLLNNLNAKIEIKPYLPRGAQTVEQSNSLGQLDQNGMETVAASVQEISPSAMDWRQLPPVVGPLRQEKVEAYLNMPQDVEQIRITLCSRLNESLCGQEYVASMKSATISFLQEQRGSSFFILMSTVTLIIVLGAFATTLHSCCQSRRKSKKAGSIERIDSRHSIDNKPIANGSSSAGGVGNQNKTSHGSTTSTNSTLANGASSVSVLNGLQSMDSINNGLTIPSNGAVSDHSSDHSRQAKLDSMLPPNYNHYADRASILMEQQQQQHQQGLMADKLASPFANQLTNNALLSVAGQQQTSPMMQGVNFTYGQTSQSLYDQQQPLSLEQTSVLDASNQIMSGLAAADGQQQQLWPQSNQQQALVDHYSNGYNHSLTYQQQPQQEMMDPTYGTTGLTQMMSQQSAVYDNTANSSNQFGSFYQQQQDPYQQYQQEIANAQQQMYGTLSRNNATYSSTTNTGFATTADDNAANQQLMDSQQQQQYGGASANGLVQGPTPTASLNQPLESDYGIAGGGSRSGRLIREIIV